MSSDATWVDEYEEIVHAVVQELLIEFRALRDRFGARPMGWIRGDIYAQLEQYLTTYRDDPAAWEGLITGWSAKVGRKNAETLALKEAIRLEEKLTDLTFPGVQAVLTQRRIQRALPLVRKAQAVMNQPKFAVREALPPLDDVAQAQQFAQMYAEQYDDSPVEA